MPTPFAPRIILSQNTRMELHALARAHSTPQARALRARIILRAADADTPTNVHIGRYLGCSPRTVGKWRRRYHDPGMLGLHDAPRSGRPRTIASPTRGQVLSVASTLPSAQGRPVTRWTVEEILATVLADFPPMAVSRSTIWRILHKPRHNFRYIYGEVTGSRLMRTTCSCSCGGHNFKEQQLPRGRRQGVRCAGGTRAIQHQGRLGRHGDE
jgi:transposase